MKKDKAFGKWFKKNVVRGEEKYDITEGDVARAWQAGIEHSREAKCSKCEFNIKIDKAYHCSRIQVSKEMLKKIIAGSIPSASAEVASNHKETKACDCFQVKK